MEPITTLDPLSPLETLEGPKPSPEKADTRRFKDVKAAYNAYKLMRRGDEESAMNRIRIQMQLDGAPPYSEAELTRRGLATIANVNFGFMEDALVAASAPYEDLIESSDQLMRMPTAYGTPEQQLDWQTIMEEEYTTMTLNSEGFDYQFSELVRQFLLHGTAVPYYEGPKGLNYRTTEMGNFLLERDIAASEKAIKLACAVREYSPDELYQMISDSKTATEQGWDVPQTWKMIKAATPEVDYSDDLELMETQWKNNDLGMAYAGKASNIRVVHMWCKNLAGKIDHMMFDAKGECDNFMYICPDKFDKMGTALTVFTNGVGTNGKYHGIRGLGYKIYAVVKEMNEIWSAFLDATRMMAKIGIQPVNNAAMKNLALVEFGHFMVVPPDTKIVPFEFPNYQQGMIPALGMLNQTLQSKAGQYTTEAAFSQTKEQTRTEIMARLDQISKLSISQLNIFYKAWTRLHRERIRRLTQLVWHKSDPDYDEANSFWEACKARGVPVDAIKKVKLSAVRAVKAIGAGSAAARTAILDRILPLVGELDAEGKNNLIRDIIRLLAGKDAADRYKPAVAGQRPPIDKKLALIENADMSQGIEYQVEPNEIHTVHMVEHLTGSNGLLQDVQALQSGQVGYEIVPMMRVKHTHCVGDPEAQIKGHMDYIPDNMPDGTPNMQKAQFREALQQVDEQIWNGEKKLQAEEQKRLEEEQEAGMQQDQNGLTPTDSRAAEQAEAALLKVQMEAEAFQVRTEQELARDQAKFDQEMAHDKAKKDADLAFEVNRETIKTATAKPKQPA